MKKYYFNNIRITKNEFEGYLYLFFCSWTLKEREQAKIAFINNREFFGLKVEG